MLFKPLDVLLPMTVFDRMSWGGAPPYLGEPEERGEKDNASEGVILKDS